MRKNSSMLKRRVTATIKRQKLRNPLDLLSPKRLDIAAKTIFARAYLEKNTSKWPEKIYKEHIRSINNFYEKEPEKNSYEDFRCGFLNVIEGVRDGDGWKHKKPVQVNNTFLMNGAHRVAASIVLKDRVNTEAPKDTYLANWGYEYFRANRNINWDGEKTVLDEDVLDAMTIEYVSLKRKDIFIAVIFPAAQGHRKEACDHLASLGEIVNVKSFRHDDFNPVEVIKQLYCYSSNDEWNNGIQFDNTRNKAIPCFLGTEDLQVYVIESNMSETTRVKEKQYLRSLWDVDKHSIHITDTIEEANRVVRMFFNENSRRFMKVQRSQEFSSQKMYDLFHEYSELAPKDVFTREKIAIEGSAIMDLLNIREGKDIDYISRSNKIVIDAENIERHDIDENIYHSETVDEILTNPAHHFYYKGYKFVDIVELKKYKERRYALVGDAKDREDVRLINIFFDKNPQYKLVKTHDSYTAPPVSVIIPAYNVEEVLPRCIESIIYQTYHNLEIIVVIDGSPDNSLEVAKRYAEIDSRIKVVNLTKNKGLFGARMAGFTAMNGDYFMTVDGDDIIESNMIERFIVAAQDSKSDIIISEGHTQLAEDGRVYPVTNTDVYVKGKKTFIEKAGEGGWGWEVWGKLYKKCVFEASKASLANIKQKVSMGEDIIYATIFTHFAKSVYRIDGEYGYLYIENNQSITRNMTVDAVIEKFTAINEVMNYVEQFLRDTNQTKPQFSSLERFRESQIKSVIQKYGNSKEVTVQPEEAIISLPGGIKQATKELNSAISRRVKRDIRKLIKG